MHFLAVLYIKNIWINENRGPIFHLNINIKDKA